MADRARSSNPGDVYPKPATTGIVDAARLQASAILSRESLLRLLLSLVLALALWLYVTGKQGQPIIYDTPFLLPVTYQSLNSNYVVNSDQIDVHLRVRLDGPNIPFNEASFRPFVNLAGLGPGLYPHLKVQVRTDPNIHVVQIIPSNIAVRIEAYREASVPVTYTIAHPAPAGYHTTVSIQPSTIRISGPASLVSQVHEGIVSLSLTDNNFQAAYAPELVNRQGQPVRGHFSVNSPDPGQVLVAVSVRAPATSRTVPVIAQLRGQPKVGFGVTSLLVSPSDVTLQGAQNKLGALKNGVKTSPVSIGHKQAGQFTTKARLLLPRGVMAAVKTVRVSVRLQTVDVGTSIAVGIAPQNVTPGYRADTNPATVLATIVGPSSTIRDIAAHLRATLNLYGYGPGTYTLRPVLTVPAGYQVTATTPQFVTVTISSR